jgi:hypothetical protein
LSLQLYIGRKIKVMYRDGDCGKKTILPVERNVWDKVLWPLACTLCGAAGSVLVQMGYVERKEKGFGAEFGCC